MDKIQALLQVSAKLYEYLLVVPKGEDRDEYIALINQHLDKRGDMIEKLQTEGFKIDSTNMAHKTLVELDRGIRERLGIIMVEIKNDMKELQNAKKNEKQYLNPYSEVRVMDGMYYDKKK